MRAIVIAITLAALGIGALRPATAAAAERVFLEEMTWTEVLEALRAGRTTVIVPTGGTEQNGPHMALGKHNAIVRFTAGEIARRLGNALVAPVLAYVPEGAAEPPSGHMRFPGTITLPDPAFALVVEHAARSFRAHGFRDVVLIGDSGENQRPLRGVAERLSRAWGAHGPRVHFVPEYYTSAHDPRGAFAQWLRAQGETATDLSAHAGLADTSLLLAVDPGLVRADRLGAKGGAGTTGAAGDPSRASVAYGQKGLELRVEATVARIRALTAPSR
jgi:creatinine amidohydrolase/Fe(II)-dependent formamide hydrolase-like protein